MNHTDTKFRKMRKKGLKKILFIILIIVFMSGENTVIIADNVPGKPTTTQDILLLLDSVDVLSNMNWLRTALTANWNCDSADSVPVNLTVMQSAGQSVPPLATLQLYDQVWDFRFNQAGCNGIDPCSSSLTTTDQQRLRDYIANGGSVAILGENMGFTGRNNGLINLVRTITGNPGFAASGFGYLSASCCGVIGPGAAAAENFNNDYNNISSSSFWTEYPGGVKLSELAGGYAAVVTNGNMDGWGEVGAIGIAFDETNLPAPYNAGKLFIWLDSQTFRDIGNTCPNQFLARNIMDFLVIIKETPTFTSTNTPTFTRTNTLTYTFTSTFTITQTFTNTFTITYTPTFTITLTFTYTPTITNTRTSTPTNTFTYTFTETFTLTVTGTPPPTWTFTDTFTHTATRTETNTATATATRTDTGTSTFTNTITSTGTPPPTWTWTNTFTETLTRTATPTFTLTNTATDTFTVTPTRTATNTATETPTAAPSPVELTLRKRASGDEPRVGNKVKYTITLENKDNGCARNIAVWDTLPDYLEFYRAISTPVPTVTGNYIYWDFTSGLTEVCYGGSGLAIEFEVEIKRLPKDSPKIKL